MAVKKKQLKKNQSKELIEKSVRIKCCYCDIKDDCLLKARKERSEKMGINTFCSLTPNRPKSNMKNRLNKA